MQYAGCIIWLWFLCPEMRLFLVVFCLFHIFLTTNLSDSAPIDACGHSMISQEGELLLKKSVPLLQIHFLTL